MIEQVVNGPLPGSTVLSSKSEESNHSKASILNLLELELIEVSSNSAGREFKGIESTTGVSRDASSLKVTFKAEERSFLSLAAGLLHVFKTLDLREVEQEQLHHDQRRVRDARRFLNNLASVIPFRESIETELGEQVGDKDTGNTKHSPATILQFSITVPVKSLSVGTEVQGVKAIISGKATVKVGRGSATRLPERACSSIDCHRAASLRGSNGASVEDRSAGGGESSLHNVYDTSSMGMGFRDGVFIEKERDAIWIFTWVDRKIIQNELNLKEM